MAECSCQTRTLTVGATSVTVPVRRNPECGQHGYPDDQWRAGDPLRRHARMVGRTIWVFGEPTLVRRLETPRETEERLLAEANGTCDRLRVEQAGFPWPIRKLPPREALRG